ncbi:citrate/2-methylcitrate synthase [Metabacillus litoralis]|jgi:citrate synthase|uniref:citrate/2-methylcitrate synthase n=1 Tax=Metabacillus litoralis TaxID=152268 RepID=UPI00203BA35C|nr:citrate/2-methylcitrate synthase [Metabacillus litoralis]MCM3653702.1 citrate/2-methylcitrate synthase [Metabacillus litoralis]
MVQRGLKNVVAAETSISLVDGENGQLIYKGYDVKELVSTYSFEEITYLLWHGDLPNVKEQRDFSELLKINCNLPPYVYQVIEALPNDMDMMSQIRTAVSALGVKEFSWKPNIEQAIRLTAVIPTICPSERNCPFFIICMASILLIMQGAVLKVLSHR